MFIRYSKYLVGDFETTVYEGQTKTEVWASACVELFSEDVHIFHSIGEQFDYFKNMKRNIIVYYHNLKFDGAFWISYLLKDLKFKNGFIKLSEKDTDVKMKDETELNDNEFTYRISELGMWYSITVRVNGKYIQFRDSLKLLPFSVKQIGKDFNTKHKKLDIEYTGYRYAGCNISPEEQEYIKNDVLVVKEALEIMFKEGHKKLTIGSCCLSEYKKILGKQDYETFYPNLYTIEISKDKYGTPTVGDYVRKSYRGGWCYLVKGKESRIYKNGITLDVNSLYPSMMSSESGNIYPVGKPKFWSGDYIPTTAQDGNHYYFVRLKTKFRIKEGMLPFIQIKDNHIYKATEMLETSDYYDNKTGKYYEYYYNEFGELQDTFVTLTMTMTDYILFLEHYDLIDCEILDGCYFGALSCSYLFDDYINKYKKIKLESTGAQRQLAKLFLNNLYGKMASSTNSSFKLAYIKDDNSIAYIPIYENDKEPGYIPVGSAITSYARNFTIRAAQKNYYGVNHMGFIYADTDSIHCDLDIEDVKGVTIDDKDFCCWKLESTWDTGYFVRQKTYIEHISGENSYYDIKCAGMPSHCKELFLKSMQGYIPSKDDNYTDAELEFLKTKRTLKDFNIGLLVPGKLIPKRIEGGVLLVPTTYEMR